MTDAGLRDIFVVARNRQEFEAYRGYTDEVWAYEWKHRMVHFVDHPSDLATLPARVFLIGQYQKRADWPLIRAEIILHGHRPLPIR